MCEYPRAHTNWRPSARVLTYYSQGGPLGELALDYTVIEFFWFDMGLLLPDLGIWDGIRQLVRENFS